MSTDFVHLHVHTQYSLLDGTIRINELFQKANEFEMPAVAITDHGNLYGVIDFYRNAKKYGVKPIIGCEFYIAPQSRFEKNTGTNNDLSSHLVIIAKDICGYKNLMRLSSFAFLEGFYYKPRIDKEILQQHAEGLIGLSACLHGEIPKLLSRGNLDDAVQVASQYREIFGDGNFYLELMENGIPEQKNVNEGLIEIAKRHGFPIVATNDCHYLNKEDSEAHDVLLCIQTGKTLNDEYRLKFSSNEFYFKSSQEMKKLFSNHPQSIENTLKISEQCNVEFEFGKFILPNFEIDPNETLDDRLKKSAAEGLEKLFNSTLSDINSNARKEYEQRLHHELNIIRSMGFAGYFLIVADFINYAKRRGIPVGPGRGSAAGSLVAYALGITNIDPIRYKLFFERFLNPDRISMPDIDTDFSPEGREEVIRYVTNKYGHDKVAQIITFGKMQARAVIRDVGRAMDLSYGEVDNIAKLVPNVLNIKLEDAIQRTPKLKEQIKANPKIKKLIDISLSLEGLNRHSSTHAAGVVISDLPLIERVPVCRSPKNEIVTQFTMKDLEDVGLTKFDFLGLKTLTVIKNALEFIKNVRGLEIDIVNVPLDDRLTYELLIRGDTDGVFQLESSGMKDILVRMKPDRIEDIIALIALYRPGPMDNVPEFIARKQGKTKILYEVPQLEPILKETYGIIVYQEQVMQIAVTIGNYTLSEADTLRKIMSKKRSDEMEKKEKPKFLMGAVQNNIPEFQALKIWEQMETFGKYGFNKSHSTAYAMISYQTAYLKAHFPVEFMAALLTSEKDNRDKIISHISSCREMGIRVLPPDINESMSDFSISGSNIRFGLAAVKNVGLGAVESIIEARNKCGKFLNFGDFCERIDIRKVNKRVIESLIKCGAFDSLGHKRRQLMLCLDDILDRAQRRNREKNSSQINFLDQFEVRDSSKAFKVAIKDIPDAEEWGDKELLFYEKDAIGFYLSGHPLNKYSEILDAFTTADSSTISKKRDKDLVFLCGIVSNIREISTKRKETMAYVTLEDLKGTISIIIFPDLYNKAYDLVRGEEPLLIKGSVDTSDENTKVIANEINLLSNSLVDAKRSAHLIIPIMDEFEEEKIKLFKEKLLKYRGSNNSFIRLINGAYETVISLGDDFNVEMSLELKKEVDKIFGAGSFKYY